MYKKMFRHYPVSLIETADTHFLLQKHSIRWKSILPDKKLILFKNSIYFQISQSKEIRTNNHLVRKWILNHLAKWLSVCLQSKWLWVRISLLSLKLQIRCLLWARSSLIFRQTVACGFNLKLVRDMIITHSIFK